MCTAASRYCPELPSATRYGLPQYTKLLKHTPAVIVQTKPDLLTRPCFIALCALFYLLKSSRTFNISPAWAAKSAKARGASLNP